MIAIILGAGFATRLHPVTVDKPKPLLEINEKPMIDYIIEELETINEINEIVVVSNHKFYDQFLLWSKSCPTDKRVKVIDDGVDSVESKRGAIGDIVFTLDTLDIDEDIMVIAGDNLFTFRLKDYYDFYQSVDSDCVIAQRAKPSDKLTQLAVIDLDEKNKVIDFEEKPSMPKTDIAAYAIYIYRKSTLPFVYRYIKEGNNPDSPGHLVSWLYSRRDVYAYLFHGDCYDVGDVEAYYEANELFKSMDIGNIE